MQSRTTHSGEGVCAQCVRRYIPFGRRPTEFAAEPRHSSKKQTAARPLHTTTFNAQDGIGQSQYHEQYW